MNDYGTFSWFYKTRNYVLTNTAKRTSYYFQKQKKFARKVV